MFSFRQRRLLSLSPQIILLAIAGSLSSFEKFTVICQVNKKLELLAGSKMVMEGCAQDFGQGQQFIVCVCACIIPLYQNPVSFLWVGRPGVPAGLGSEPQPVPWALPQEILLGTAAKMSRPAFVGVTQFLMFSTLSPKHY